VDSSAWWLGIGFTTNYIQLHYRYIYICIKLLELEVRALKERISELNVTSDTGVTITNLASVSSNNTPPLKKRARQRTMNDFVMSTSTNTSQSVVPANSIGHDLLTDPMRTRPLHEVVYQWYISEMHKFQPEFNSNQMRRLNYFGRLIYFFKRFLPDGTTIPAKPTDPVQLVNWTNLIATISRSGTKALLQFVHDVIASSDNNKNTTKKQRRRKPSSYFYPVMKALDNIPLSTLPQPKNVQDLATKDSNYFYETPAMLELERKRNRAKARSDGSALVPVTEENISDEGNDSDGDDDVDI